MPDGSTTIEQRERAFWNAVASGRGDGLEDVLSYADYMRRQELIWRKVHGLALRLCGEDLSGREVLDLGCGTGVTTTILAERGANVTCVDVSEEMVSISVDRARRAGLAARVEGVVGTAGELAARGRQYDLIFTGAVLHHLADFERDVRYLAAMLKPGGRLIAYEPFSSAVSDFGRAHSPGRHRTHSADERPLTRRHCEWLRSVFPDVRVHRFGPFTAVERVARTGSEALWRLLRLLDRAWFALFGDRMCWHVVVEATAPAAADGKA